MKTLAISFFAILLFSSSLNASIVHCPDENFKSPLINNPAINTNGNEAIKTSTAEAYDKAIEALGDFLADSTSAWRKGFRFGIAAGANSSYFPGQKPFFKFGQKTRVKTESSQQLGYHVYGIISYSFTENINFEMRLGLLHSRINGLRTRSVSTTGFLFSSYTGRLYTEYDTLVQQSTWLECPFIIQVRPSSKKAFFFEVGATTALRKTLEGSYSVSHKPAHSPTTTYDSGALDNDFQAGIYLGLGFYFLKQSQISISWSGRQVTSQGDGTLYSNRRLPIRLWRLTVGQYF